MSERRECIPHRGCCRIVMLVASGPARRANPSSRFILSVVRSVPALRLFPIGDLIRPNAPASRSRQADGSAPKSFPVPPGGSEADHRQAGRQSLRTASPALPSGSFRFRPSRSPTFPDSLPKAVPEDTVDRPTIARLSLHLRFAGPVSGQVRRPTSRVFRYCCGHRCRHRLVRKFPSLSRVYSG